ncbi:MAG: 5'-deoxyadenosine deaminase [Nitrospirae bacterium]|nr:5'-deoxyadenosine deaminase [Nitrospirota bacterium]MCE7965766.1 amidohydrolase [Nitrospira sp. NTP2]
MSKRATRKAGSHPIDPLIGPKLALSGRVVMMDDAFTVLPRGVLYIEQGAIVAVREAGEAPPDGFQTVPVVNSRGTIFPGLIELHNHLAYNILRLWAVPRRFTNRDQWAGTPAYRALISGPMQILGKTPELVPALVRYVECKGLLGGVTTSQGIQLFSNAGLRRFYEGLVRNVEHTNDAALPEALTRVADVEARNAAKFLVRLKKASCFLLHLSEGIDETARKHFLALKVADDEWAIGRSLAGIHCAALTVEDFGIFGERQGAMIWSPLSNLLLYGQTARIKAAKEAGVRIGLGSDWSPSGSKNLLCELKVARLVSEQEGGLFTDRDLVAMATREAAAILRWDAALGSLEPEKRADLLVVTGTTGDPYEALVTAKETAIRLVMVNGVARYGLPSLMRGLGAVGEEIRVGGLARQLFLEQVTADPMVGAVTLKAATQVLKEALQRLPELAREREQPGAVPRALARSLVRGMPRQEEWTLALDELEDTGVDLRPRLPLAGERELTGPTRVAVRAAEPLSKILIPLELDPLTIADDKAFFLNLEDQPNLPAFVKIGLKALS